MHIEQDTQPLGTLLRRWRQRRRHSQLSLASEAEISQRHLSFLESGRSSPSREMILRLAETLRLPLRDRNELLLAAGFAPAYGETALEGPNMAEARAAIEAVLAGHAPHLALAVDRGWTILEANAAVAGLTEGAAPHLLEGQVNAFRLSLHPEGVAPRIVNYGEWRAHVLSRLANDIDLSSDARLIALRDELKGYPAPPGAAGWSGSTAPSVAVPLVVLLSFFPCYSGEGGSADGTITDREEAAS